MERVKVAASAAKEVKKCVECPRHLEQIATLEGQLKKNFE